MFTGGASDPANAAARGIGRDQGVNAPRSRRESLVRPAGQEEA